MNKILLIGQPTDKNRKGTVGSGGGYVRNMRVYLKYFQSENFRIVPCFHTSRKEYGANIFSKFIRFLIDLKRFLHCLVTVRPNGIHIMAQYREALPREVMYIFISKIFNKPVLYEIKAGAFIDAYVDGSKIYKQLVRYSVLNSKIILAEGRQYLDFLMNKFEISGNYFPNVVPDEEVPSVKKNLLTNKIIKILYVGYCYYEKGVFHLVDAVKMLKANNISVELNFVGEEDNDFSEYLREILNTTDKLRINRFGGKPHEFILSKMQECDIFCYPTFHSGEGHSNSINEAMMNTMVIISTRNGFLSDILNEESAYFIKEKSSTDIYSTLMEINNNRKTASEKAINAYNNLKNNYLLSTKIDTINDHYNELVSNNA